jgi:hypothetical protein
VGVRQVKKRGEGKDVDEEAEMKFLVRGCLVFEYCKINSLLPSASR